MRTVSNVGVVENAMPVGYTLIQSFRSLTILIPQCHFLVCIPKKFSNTSILDMYKTVYWEHCLRQPRHPSPWERTHTTEYYAAVRTNQLNVHPKTHIGLKSVLGEKVKTRARSKEFLQGFYILQNSTVKNSKTVHHNEQFWN